MAPESECRWWPDERDRLIEMQLDVGGLTPAPWRPSEPPSVFAACFFCDDGGGRAWAAAVLTKGHKLLEEVVVDGPVRAPYEPGLLALREGPLLARALGSLAGRAQVLVVNASGRDHPRRCGLAVHLSAALDLPSIGVTDRPLAARGADPTRQRGARSPLVFEGETVGYKLRSRTGARPISVHAAWRTTPEQALELAGLTLLRARTPQPLRAARRCAREARAAASVSR